MKKHINNFLAIAFDPGTAIMIAILFLMLPGVAGAILTFGWIATVLGVYYKAGVFNKRKQISQEV